MRIAFVMITQNFDMRRITGRIDKRIFTAEPKCWEHELMLNKDMTDAEVAFFISLVKMSKIPTIEQYAIKMRKNIYDAEQEKIICKQYNEEYGEILTDYKSLAVKDEQTYFINYNNNVYIEVTGLLGDAKIQAFEGMSYTEKDVSIEDATGKEMARSIWCAGAFDFKDDNNGNVPLKQFDVRGYYTDWIDYPFVPPKKNVDNDF